MFERVPNNIILANFLNECESENTEAVDGDVCMSPEDLKIYSRMKKIYSRMKKILAQS